MSVLASDTFTRADATTLGANWGSSGGLGTSCGIVSNQVDVTVTGSRCGNTYTAVTWPDDHYSKATVVALPSNTWAVLVRMQVGASRNYYAAGVNPNDFGDSQTRIWKEVAGVETGLATSGTVDITAGSVVELDIQSTTLTCKVDGITKVSVTDGSFPSGTPGILLQHTAINVGLLDNWEGGDFGGAPPPPDPDSDSGAVQLPVQPDPITVSVW
jgi:hypothetical protein